MDDRNLFQAIMLAKQSVCIAMLNGSGDEIRKANLHLETALNEIDKRKEKVIAQIVIPGCPITKKNSQQIYINPKTKKPFITSSPQYKAYEEMAGYHIKCKGAMLPCRLNVRCNYFLPTRRRVDMVNLLEATCDILTRYKVIEDDHSGIVCSHDGSTVGYDKENPRVEITISRLVE